MVPGSSPAEQSALGKGLTAAKETIDLLRQDRDVAPWAGQDSILHRIDLVLRCLLFLFLAAVFCSL